MPRISQPLRSCRARTSTSRHASSKCSRSSGKVTPTARSRLRSSLPRQPSRHKSPAPRQTQPPRPRQESVRAWKEYGKEPSPVVAPDGYGIGPVSNENAKCAIGRVRRLSARRDRQAGGHWFEPSTAHHRCQTRQHIQTNDLCNRGRFGLKPSVCVVKYGDTGLQ
jgi:hypothetical protein